MKKLLLLATTTLLSAGTYAGDVSIDSDDLKLQLLGRFNFQGGYAKQSKGDGIERHISTNRKNFAFNSNAFTAARVTAEKDEMKYGAQLSLFTNTQGTGSPAYDRSHIFIESNFGKIELGSSFSSTAKMSITALDIARAAGGDGTDYAKTYIEGKAGDPQFPGKISAPTYPGFFLDSANLDKHAGESSRKVTYYTPEFNGFQVGISYIPDSGNLGSSSLKDDKDDYNQATKYVVSTTTPITNVVTETTYAEKKPVRDAYTIALAYKHIISDYASFKLSAAGEYGKAANSGTIDVKTTTPAVVAAPGVAAVPEKVDNATQKKYKLSKLSTYNIGGVLTLGNYAFGASYGDLGKSMTSSQVLGTKRSTRYYTIGTAYVQGPVGVSLVYSNAKQYGNKMDIYTLGTDYKLAPGLLPYAEFAYFNGKAGLPAAYNSNAAKQKFKGYVFILGAKLTF